MSEEQWKDVVEYEGLYQVSDMGRIKSLRYGGGIREKILKPWKNKNGNKYRLMVSLWKDKSKDKFYVHQLVLGTFVGPCPHGLECCHNDGNSENNSTDNLRWDTHQNNMKDMIDDGNHWFSNNPGLSKGVNNARSKLDDTKVIRIIECINKGIPQFIIAKQFDISQSTISAIKNHRMWRHLTNRIKIESFPNTGSSKLTTEDLIQIRKSIAERIPSKDIAILFNVSFNTINRIKKNHTNRSR